jgi:hypothetical protein
MAEHPAVNRRVVGSSPTGRAKFMEDKSRFQADKLYRCKSEECRKVSLGRDLLPIMRRQLVDDPSHPYGVREVGDLYISNRVCPFDRGLMEREEVLPD